MLPWEMVLAGSLSRCSLCISLRSLSCQSWKSHPPAFFLCVCLHPWAGSGDGSPAAAVLIPSLFPLPCPYISLLVKMFTCTPEHLPERRPGSDAELCHPLFAPHMLDRPWKTVLFRRCRVRQALLLPCMGAAAWGFRRRLSAGLFEPSKIILCFFPVSGKHLPCYSLTWLVT